MYKTHADQYKNKRTAWKLRPALNGIDKETEKSVLNVLRNGPWYTGGEESESLETEAAEYFKSKYTLSCGSGTAAWHLILMGYGIGQGDEVIMPANAFMSVVCALVRENGKPILVDVEEETYNIDPIKAEKAITPKTKAIVLSHMGGHPADIDAFMDLGEKYNIKIIGDACRSLGGKYKGKPQCSIPDATFASIGCKKIGSAGLGGLIFTNDKELADKIYLMRGYGKDAWAGNQIYYYFGLNYEISEIQAAVARHQLRKLNEWTEKRRSNAKTINELLKDIPEIILPIEKSWAYHVYDGYLLKILEKKDELCQFLKNKGIKPIFNGPGHYPFIHMQKPIQERFGYKIGDFLILENQIGKIFILNVDWNRKKDEITYIPKLIKEFYSN